MWWFSCDVGAVPAGTGWLAPGEIDRAARLRYDKRRTEYLLRRFAAKQAVAAVLGLPTGPPDLARIEVANAPDGAPEVFLAGAPAGLDISLSDRADLAFCVVGHGALGCDLELVEPRSDGFVRDFLTATEQRYVAEQPDAAARHLTATLVWSAKESALKVLRAGLRRDTRDVEVTIHHGSSHGWTPLTVATANRTVMPGWWRRDGAYLFTVASEVPGPPPVEVAAIPRSSADTR